MSSVCCWCPHGYEPISWNSSNFVVTTHPERKNTTPPTGSQQLAMEPTFSCPSTLESCQASSCAGMMLVTTAAMSWWVQWPHCIVKTGSSPSSGPSNPPGPLSLVCSESEEGVSTGGLWGAEHSEVAYSQRFDQLRAGTHYCPLQKQVSQQHCAPVVYGVNCWHSSTELKGKVLRSSWF